MLQVYFDGIYTRKWLNDLLLRMYIVYSSSESIIFSNKYLKGNQLILSCAQLFTYKMFNLN